MGKYEDLIENLKRHNLIVLTPENDYHSAEQIIDVTDGVFKSSVKAQNYISAAKAMVPRWFAVNNPYLIENVNKFYEINNNGSFKCVSTELPKTRHDLLEFECTRCGKRISKSLNNALRRDKDHHGIQCPNCDQHFESLHALVLKQMFKHYYPDTVEEDPSCINPQTGAILPTDIVNHRLKIAIEVQGQWHRFEWQKGRDKIKKEFWLSKGYKFYDYEIENISVLDYIRYFFPDIYEIPEWIKMDYNKKINIVEAQKLLNSGMKVSEVANKMKINPYRIYDALQFNKLHYPDEYIKSTRRPVVMLDRYLKYIKEYPSYTEAEKDNGIYCGLISSCIYYKHYFCNGFYWIPKDLYESGNYKIPDNRTNKFYFPVIKYDLSGNELGIFEDMYQAAKDIGTIAYKINEVVNGRRKSIKGFCYRYK